MIITFKEYADQCKGMVHSEGYNENLAACSCNNVTRIFDLWMREKNVFDRSGYRAKLISTNFNGTTIGQYSQIVWAANSKFGCGYKYCDSMSMNLLVCRYETGNILNQQVYGEPLQTIYDDYLEQGTDGGISRLVFNKPLFSIFIILTIFYVLL